jgi:hypothetical protein
MGATSGSKRLSSGRTATSLSAYPRVAIVLLAALGGCRTTGSIAPEQLGRLDGFDTQYAETAARQVETLDGRQLTFDPSATLRLDLRERPASGQFTAIRVQNDVFVGRTVDGREVEIPVSMIERATVEKPADLATELIVAGAVVVALGLASLLVLALRDDGPQVTAGRALRLRRKPVTAPLGTDRGWIRGQQPAVSELSREGRAALATHWQETALAEHASVPAFSRLSITLMALGAPSRFVDGAHRAAREEVEHARMAFSMASAYAGHPVAPGPLAALADAAATTATSLSTLAAESVIDGCLLEGFAAATIAAGQTRAGDPAVRTVLAQMARDEASHAQLAWEIVAWCIEEEGPGLGSALMALVERAPMPAPPAGFQASLETELGRHGWLPPSEWRQLFASIRAAVADELRELSDRRAVAA